MDQPPEKNIPDPQNLTKKQGNRNQFWSPLIYTLLVIGVAFLLATFFSAWTPGQPLLTLENRPETTRKPLSATTIPTSDDTTLTAIEIPSDAGKIKIGIVAGHWGNDSGAVCADGLTEGDLNLQVASIVQKKLNELGYEVDILKEFDPKLSGYKASALVSIHADSCDYINNDATGYKVAASMANPRPERSARLTACLRGRYGQVTGLPIHSQSVTSDMTSYHAFGEIDETTTAAIIEIGFLNLDREYLTNNTEAVASGILSGVICFLNNESVVLPTPTNQP